jgi:2-hydroxy-3-keto-5-methylthiopentenyl-1-phosphate phosphatase
MFRAPPIQFPEKIHILKKKKSIQGSEEVIQNSDLKGRIFIVCRSYMSPYIAKVLQESDISLLKYLNFGRR